MGSSKIVFVGAVAVIIGLFGVGIKKSEKNSATIASTHAYQLIAKTVADQALVYVVENLPKYAASVTASSYEYSTSEYTAGYSRTISGMPAKQVKITSYGICNKQKATVVTIVEELPDGPIPANVRCWKNWKQVSSVRTLSVLP